MKICDYCKKEIKGQEYTIKISKWFPKGDCKSEEVLFKELHSNCADEVIGHIKKNKRDLQKIGEKTTQSKV